MNHPFFLDFFLTIYLQLIYHFNLHNRRLDFNFIEFPYPIAVTSSIIYTVFSHFLRLASNNFKCEKV